MKIVTLIKFKDSTTVAYEGLDELLKVMPTHNLPALMTRLKKGFQKDEYIVFYDADNKECIYKLKDICSVEFLIDPPIIIKGDE
ncbi:hypothetical protein [Paenibacillus odorifer]|uniref:hypothetical protein n=1 Tax=Paenibacillus odorifer TaxID=189426 RepID=UPI00096DAD43|nr:hypothetical protein [Paenibacillus odorifer]OME41412.1 hypothetical protein BSK58_14860 [Paenibacillus odorifer]